MPQAISKARAHYYLQNAHDVYENRAASVATTMWVVGLVIMCVLLLILVVVVAPFNSVSAAQTPSLSVNTARNRASTKARSNILPRYLSVSSPPTPPSRVMICVPLRWDTDEGAFMISAKTGKHTVELVFDTGSSQLSVKGGKCKWTSCTDDLCEVKKCPTGKLDTAYIPTGEQLRPGESGAGTMTTLTYGSQEDSVEHFLDTLHLPYVEHDAASVRSTCDMLLFRNHKNQESRKKHKHNNQFYITIEDVVVHRVYAITGTSTSNLFGFARAPTTNKYRKRNGEHTLSEMVLNPAKITKIARVKQWSLVLHEKTGWFVAGTLPACFNTVMQYAPLVTPHELADLVTHFYIVNILHIQVGPSLDKMRQLAPQDTPDYCIVDTGTTMTYGPSKLGSVMRNAGYVEHASYFILTLGTPQHHITLSYSPATLRDPEYPESSLLQVDPDTTLDGYDDIFLGQTVLLLGVLQLLNRTCTFDIGNNRFSVQDTPSQF